MIVLVLVQARHPHRILSRSELKWKRHRVCPSVPRAVAARASCEHPSQGGSQHSQSISRTIKCIVSLTPFPSKLALLRVRFIRLSHCVTIHTSLSLEAAGKYWLIAHPACAKQVREAETRKSFRTQRVDMSGIL